MTSLIIDILAAALIITAFTAGMKKGLVKSVWKAAAWIITAALVFILLHPVTDFLSGTQTAVHMNDKVYAELQSNIPMINSGELNLPKFFVQDINTDTLTNEAVTELSRQITLTFIKIVSFVILFVLIRLILALIFRMLDVASKLPVINGANKLLGGLLGIINMLFVIYIVCAALSLFTANERITEIINSSYIVKYFYNNNILMQLILRI